VRALTQPAFVDEDDLPAFRLGFLLMAGHRTLFQASMALIPVDGATHRPLRAPVQLAEDLPHVAGRALRPGKK
jgi:hypothetical protein